MLIIVITIDFLIEPEIVDCSCYKIEYDAENHRPWRPAHLLNRSPTHKTETWSLVCQN